MYAKAFTNNDVAIIQWHYDGKIKDCLGFRIERVNNTDGKKEVLPAWVGFKGEENKQWKARDTGIWPVQKYNWRDFTAKRDNAYSYIITPMIGKPDSLKPTADKNLILKTKPVKISEGTGKYKVFFNRGILSTQSVSHALDKSKSGKPNSTSLLKSIQTPGNKLRNKLSGEMIDAVLTLVRRAKKEGGKCYCALYELTDPELIKNLIGAKKNIEIILTNADGSDSKTKKKIVDGTNIKFRKELKKAGVKVIDRIVASNHIGHNKFVLYVNKNKKPTAVLTGSTNWTPTGLCAQSNNSIIIESGKIAKYYLDYWNRLKDDTDKKGKGKQGEELRAKDNKVYAEISGKEKVNIWYSPNTKQQSKPKNPPTPSDMKEVFGLIENAKKSIHFLAFQPGTPSIIDKILEVQMKNKKLFIRGAATDAKAVENYNTALYHGTKKRPDFYNFVAASNINDQFAYWEKELLKSSNFAHAIIHDKIVVTDAFSDNCAVVTGSHNLGFKASYSNDENMVIIKGNKEVASAYAAHIMDVYDHYRWRYKLSKEGVKKAYNGLDTTDKWQNYYFDKKTISGKTEYKSPKKMITYWK
jgi:phosphatidylserine/phosphatidylglycerophosphate/cardiolipin synthase-like enzyme